MGYIIFDKNVRIFFVSGVDSGIQSKHATRPRYILVLFETSGLLEDMDLPGLSLYELKGQKKDFIQTKSLKNIDGDIFDINTEDIAKGGGTVGICNPPHPGEIIKEFCSVTI